jgi:sugar lactone lactonase YvrE
MALAVASHAAAAEARHQDGRVTGLGAPVAGATVTLYRAGARPGAGAVALGRAVTGPGGRFRIDYAPPAHDAVLYLVADGPRRGVRLATVLGPADEVPRNATLTERTTVATAFAMAQFLSGADLGGDRVGVRNAAATLRNMVDLETGDAGRVLRTAPNGDQTSTLATFNSLGDMLAACVASAPGCRALFALAAPPGGRAPRDTLQAALDIAHFPAQRPGALWSLSITADAFRPALRRPPVAFILALKYVGDGREFDGPGNLVVDAEGDVWITNNYEFRRNHDRRTCGSNTLSRLLPDGRDHPGAPYVGGGLDGAGFGITMDPSGRVWVGNFGFFGSTCPPARQPAANSVSLFSGDGVPLSPQHSRQCPDGGFCQGDLSSPQGTVSDVAGNIWIANTCGASLTQYLGGDPDDNRSFDLDAIGAPSVPTKPFAIAFDAAGNAWITDNGNGRVLAVTPDGAPLFDPVVDPAIRRPLGLSIDRLGNAWVSDSQILDVPCPQPDGSPPDYGDLTPGDEPFGLTEIAPDGTLVATYAGGGIQIPWGNAIDGAGHVWVANFGGQSVSEFCGAEPDRCPPGLRTGDPISPPAGWFSDAMQRSTALAIDAAGNVWATNNWLLDPVQTNPGGDGMVVFVGLATPVRTPLLGPPQRP